MDKKVLHTVIDAIAEKYPENIAVETPGGKFTYHSLYTASEYLKNVLLQMGLKKGDIVAVYMHGGFDYISAVLAINKAGGVFMPLLPGSPVKRLLNICNKVLPAFLITDESQQQSLLQLSAEMLSLPHNRQLLCFRAAAQQLLQPDGTRSWKLRESSASVPVQPAITGDDSCYIIYTSGSTGEPKIIEGVHKGLAHFIHWQMSTFGVNCTDRVSQLAPVSFDVSFRDIFLPLSVGGTVCIPPPDARMEPKKLLSWLSHTGITLMHIVPSVLRLLTRELEQQLPETENMQALRYIFPAGEPLYYRDVMNWKAVTAGNTILVNLYGPSETTLAKLYYQVDLSLPGINGAAIVPLGKPISNSGVAIMQGNVLCNEGEIGEICIKTPFRTKGYWKDEVMTAEKFVQNPLHNEHIDIIYRTGDLGKQQPDGNIVFMGRRDGQLKIRGNRVELLEVEKVITGMPGVRQSLVTPHHKDDGDILLICYYTGTKVYTEEITQQLKDYLPEYMLPAYWVHLEEFPLGINGKIDRAALPQPEALLYESKAYTPPASAYEAALAEIWADIVGLEKVGTQHSFFELGGHSLSATRVVSEIYRRLGTEISLKEFWTNNTIAALAELLTSKKRTGVEPLPLAPVSDSYPLSPAQESMWLACQLGGFEKAYIMGGVFSISADVDRALLEKAFRIVIERHESLRTIFPKINGMPVQKILSAAEYSFSIAEIIPAAYHSAEEAIGAFFDIPFRLETGPLIRAAVIPGSVEESMLLFVMHHLISDAWSNRVLLREVLTAYESLTKGESPRFMPLSFQYKDFAFLENSRQQALEQDRSYWLKHLQDIGNEVTLPADYDRREVVKNTSATVYFQLDEELSLAVRKYIQLHDCSLFMLFVATLNLLMFRYTGARKISLGTPVAGRRHPVLEEQIGLYLNYIVLRSEIDTRITFSEYLEQVKRYILDAYEHQAYPYHRLAAELAERSASPGSPLYNMLIVMNNASLNADEQDIRNMERILGFSGYRFEHKYGKLDISCFVNDEKQVSFSIEYKTELYKPETIQDFGNKWKRLLLMVIETPGAPSGDILYQVAALEEQAFLMDSMDTITDEF